MAQPQYGGGILRVASAGKTAEAMRVSDKEFAASKQKAPSPAMTSLYSYLWNIWEQNRRHKEGSTGVQEQMMKNLRARNNQYDPDKLSEIKAAGMPDVFMGLTNVKCAHAEAWLLDIYSSAPSDKSWSLQPTPKPYPVDEVSQVIVTKVQDRLKAVVAEVKQNGSQPPTDEQFAEIVSEEMANATKLLDEELLSRTKSMETKIYDQLTEGGWAKAFEECICDIVTMKAGIVKGPIVRTSKRITYEQTETGESIGTVVPVSKPNYWRVSPLDIYPSPTAESVNDGSLIEKTRFSRKELSALRDEPGYDKAAIERVLSNYAKNVNTITTDSDSDRETVEDKDADAEDPTFREDIDGLEIWCSVQGKALVEHGLNKIPSLVSSGPVKDLDEYDINSILVGGEVIYVALNDDATGARPYSKTGWRKVPGSFWYKGVPELMEDLQRIVNAAVRSLCYNMSMAAGPQVELDVNRLVPGENLESAFPGKVWQTINPGNAGSPAVRFFQPDSNATELFGIYENFAKLADDYTGIPAYAYGSDQVAGAGRTSSGLSMLMGAAAKGIKRVILAIDMDIFKTVVRRQFDWNMKYDPDPSIKGDIDIVTTGAVAIMVKEQMSERRMQFLNATNNEMDFKITGLEGRANILREAASALEMSNAKIVKSAEEIKKMEASDNASQAAAMQAQQQVQQAQQQLQLQGMQLANQVKEMQLQVEQQKMALELEKLKSSTQVEQGKVMLDKMRVDMEGMRVQIEGEKMQLENRRLQLEALEKRSKVDSDLRRLELETHKAQLDTVDRGTKADIEERRFQVDAADRQARFENEKARTDSDISSQGIQQLQQLVKDNKEDGSEPEGMDTEDEDTSDQELD